MRKLLLPFNQSIMGMRTTLYGYVEEMDFWESPIKELIKNHNNSIINSLEKNDKWPPLSKEMFHITRNSNSDSPNLEYWGGIIHFGANLKSVEHEIEEWIIKFEKLLSRLIWQEAKVHFQTEYSDLQTLCWNIDFDKYKVEHNGILPNFSNKSQWIFESTWKLKK